ncbi:hypothetical protein P389DRAFT_166125 [Cystobasidium minutum MCA 4210]|uniref:uncharacterized protein n=1 Tax=Cystobasidium minutum MCA 4210 TaxID=1397322 RepID=UPI0034CEF0C4|eukprot:jgi/Rhomi1/166125/fgenesh1_kg.1_\
MTPPIGVLEPYNNHTFPGACEATELYTAEQVCAEKSRRWVNWYIADYVYAQPTAILICVFIALFAIVHQYSVYQSSRQNRSRSRIYYRILALGRWLAIKQFRIPGWSSVSIGNCLILAGLGLFFLLMTVVPQPYYWPEIGWAHSPPLGTRTGWMALALLPFLITLASKRNPIAVLTGLSHERLQLFHRWCAFFMLLLGLIHTFAFVRYNAKAGTSQMMWSMSSSYWTGVAMLVPQIWLTFMSVAPIRNKYYEFFKMSHRTVAAIFTVFFFLHCGWTLTSWDYFWALLGVYGSALLVRGILIIRNKLILRGSHAHLSVLDGNMLEIRIPNSGLHWKAGQHFFFRFTGLNFFDSLQAHPFTACTVPETGGGDLIALAKIRRGLMLDLANHAFWQHGLHADVWVDGPYGASLKMLPAYKKILLLGGGSGLSFVTSAANELVHTHGRTDFHVVAVCRDQNQLQAYLDLLPNRSETKYRLTTRATGLPIAAGAADVQPLLSHSQVDAEKQEKKASGGSGCCSSGGGAEKSERVSPHEGEEAADEKVDHYFSAAVPPQTIAVEDIKSARPDLKSIITQEVAEASGSRLAIVACGPESFMRDVQDQVAQVQMDILKGRSKVKEVYLRSEAFHW